MNIQRFKIMNREQWFDLRGQDITASVAGALVGVHEYTTAYALWAEKTGRVQRPKGETPQTRRGRLLEPVAVELLGEERPTWKIRKGEHYYRDPSVRLGATPDVLASIKGRPGIVQVKTVEAGVFRQKWLAEDGVVDVPTWIAIQTIVEAHLTGANWAAVAVMVVGNGLDMHVVDVPIHEGVIDRVRAETVAFWKLVEAGGEPPPDYHRDGVTLASVYRTDNGTEIDLSDDQGFRDLIAARYAAKQMLAVGEKHVDELDAKIIHRIGHADRVHCPGWRVTRPLVRRVDPVFGTITETRQLRITPTKEA